MSTEEQNSEQNWRTKLEFRVDLTSVVAAVVLVFIGVKSLTLLPEQYYFGFSKIFYAGESSEFFIEPPRLTVEEYNEILQRNGYSAFEGFVRADGSFVNESEEIDRRIQAVSEEIIAAGEHRFWISLLLKMSPPFVAGILMFILWRNESFRSAPIGAAITAFLFCWPVIVSWDLIVYDAWNKQRYLFYILYLAYVVLYYHLARLGCVAGRFMVVRKWLVPGEIEVNLGKIFSSMISTGITVAVTYIVTTAIVRA